MTIEETIAAVVEAKVRPLLEELKALRAELRPSPAVVALLTVEEVAERCGKLTPETVRGWIHEGKLPAKRAGSRYLVAPADLERFLAADPGGKVPVDAEEQLADVLKQVNRREAR